MNNACATQAILSILLNNPEIDLGKELSEFKAFTRDFSPQVKSLCFSKDKGMAISNYETLKEAHNSFSKNEYLSIERKGAKSSEDSFHFVAYLNINGQVVEFDGLRNAPILHKNKESERNYRILKF